MRTFVYQMKHDCRKRRLVLLACLSLIAAAVTGCTRFTVPAPQGFVKPFAEPVIDTSTINLPITVSFTSLTSELDRFLPEGQGEIISNKLQGFLSRHASRLDNSLLENEYVREQADKAWNALNDPIKLTADVSLLLNPQAVSLSQLPARQEAVTVLIGLTAKPKLVAGNAAPATRPPLPPLSISPPSPAKGFHVALESELTLDFLGRELTKGLAGKEYPAGLGSVVVRDVKLYSAGEKVVIAAAIDGSAKGTVYLSGIPEYDESSRMLSVRAIEYTIESKEVLTRVAERVLHAGLRESLSEKATWYVGDKLDEAKDLLSKALNRRLNRYVSISGNIRTLRPLGVRLTGNALKAVLVADGTAELRIF